MYPDFMEWLNYHHLFYFWTVAREGSVARACSVLRLAQPTVSGQIRLLEEALGEKLFVKAGRGLALTDTGQVVYRYAGEIFGIGRELLDVLKGRPRGRPAQLTIGVSDMVPKLIAYRVIEPALALAEPVHLICQEDSPARLIADLAEHRLDLVLADAPLGAAPLKAFNHLLGSCGVSIFGTAALADRYRAGFPASLDGAPFLLPIEGSLLRRALAEWFDANRIEPRVVGEFKDGALMKAFGQAGVGLFAAPDAIEREVRAHYRVERVGGAEPITERFYAISIERKLKHPAVVAISNAARERLFPQRQR